MGAFTSVVVTSVQYISPMNAHLPPTRRIPPLKFIATRHNLTPNIVNKLFFFNML